MDKEKKMSWQLGGSYDCKEGSSAMADGRRVRSRLSPRPSGSENGDYNGRTVSFFFFFHNSLFLRLL